MTQLSKWSKDSDVEIHYDDGQYTVIVNSAPVKTYSYKREQDYMDKLIELVICGYKVKDGLIRG